MTLHDDEICACGVSRIWATRLDDPFIEACRWHDGAYSQGSWQQLHMTRLEVDQAFLEQMLVLAGSSLYLKFRAHLFYSIVRAVGDKLWEGKVVSRVPQTASLQPEAIVPWRAIWEGFCELEYQFVKQYIVTT